MTGSSVGSAQATSAETCTPPVPSTAAGRYTTIYDIPSTLCSAPDAVLETVLGTQRPATELARVPSADGKQAQLVAALQAMERASPPELFMGKYHVVRDRVSGGQATVQFVRGGEGGFFQYAIKCARPSAVQLGLQRTCSEWMHMTHVALHVSGHALHILHHAVYAHVPAEQCASTKSAHGPSL